jgi:alkanesulfonate monooxygenase SsuD/methylene tetrahydromethanopterin reductase-like flavin-dependent oxidoreductase (luciferase family)
MEILEEQLAIVRGAWADGPFSFAGKHYRLDALDAQPKPVQRPHPPVIIGGIAKPRTARLAARLADEYNTVYATPAECAERRAVVEAAWREAGRDPATMTFSVMVPWVSGGDSADLRQRAERLATWRGTDAPSMLEEFARLGVAGTFDESLARMREYRDAGVDRIMLQHLLHDDIEAIGLLGRLAAAVG